MCLFLQGNRSDQLRVILCNTSYLLNDQKARKSVVRAFFYALTPSLRELTRRQAEIFFSHLDNSKNIALTKVSRKSKKKTIFKHILVIFE